ncbi:ATP-binding protein [Streptomyces chitinivorans]|uniref:ATP-binding protein n=1 Tax=Streptomyces chitinivorans TaxID=1257027 RepID=A0ABW7HRK0_9ACTN|nr:ATP-binding protein [Streptomyces chitinivorans]MDH2410709.1 ATP-binding protein [Streptomyces chitinivorans]
MDEYTSTVQVWELSCPRLPAEVGRARRWTRDILHDSPCADDAALIVTELGANAVTHTTGPAFRVTITRTAEAVKLTVTDTGATTTHPRITHPHQDATHGRGLEIVATLADDLKVHHTAHGHTVTARLSPPAALPAAREAQPC